MMAQRCRDQPHASHSWSSLACETRPLGKFDPLGTRRDGVGEFLDQEGREGYVIETRSDAHAIIFRRPKGFKRFTSGPDPGRFVVQVDEDGSETMRPAEPQRT